MRVILLGLVCLTGIVAVACRTSNPGVSWANSERRQYEQAEDFKAWAATAGAAMDAAAGVGFCSSASSPSNAVSCALRQCRDAAQQYHATADCEITMLGDRAVSAFDDLPQMMAQYEQEVRGSAAPTVPAYSPTSAGGPDSCRWARDLECDDTRYIGAITGACLHGTDASDCRGLQLRPPRQLVGNSCQWAFDGECDETRYRGAKTGVCQHGTDTADCQSLTLRSAQELVGNTCRWAFNGTCDSLSIGSGACLPGTDMADCGGR